MAADEAHPWHEHAEHELVCTLGGSFRLEVGGRSWLVAPGTGVWIPRRTVHRMVTNVEVTCGWALIPADRCPTLWSQLTSVTVDPLMRHLLVHLSGPLGAEEREHAEQVLFDLLRPQVSSPTIELPMPTDDRCRRIATAIFDDPRCEWELADWSEVVGASARTLGRLFREETSMSFGQWRTNARVRAAIAELAEGRPVSMVARRVGYSNASSFITAFRRTTGRTPSSYFPVDDLDEVSSRRMLALA